MTDRLPLDLPEPERTWTVREFGNEVRSRLHGAFPTELWIQGELRNLRPNARDGKRNLFFDLVEPGAGLHGKAEASVHVVLWDEQRREVNATLTAGGPTVKMDEGVRLRVRGRVEWWRRSGDLRLIMQAIDPVFTLGQLADDRERVLRDLAANGLLGANAARALVPVPLRVGLVTSADSAAEHDVLHELESSGLGFRIVAVDSPVQGPHAPAAVVRAIVHLEARGVDVIVVARGGGARTDLASFDHPSIARAIARCAVPVFTGIGHEIDRSVADEVAHTACKTPTAAAAAIVTQVRNATDQLDRLWEAATTTALRHVSGADRWLAESAERVASRASRQLQRAGERRAEHEAQIGLRAERALRRESTRLGHFAGQIPQRTHLRLRRATDRLDAVERTVQALDPSRLLARGWSITRRPDGSVVRGPGQVTAGDLLITELAGGRVTSRAESIEESTDA